MKMRLLLTLAGFAISFALPTFAQEQNAVDPEVRQQIRLLTVKFDEAYNKNDPTPVASFYTEDGIQVTPHDGTFHGPQAIAKSFASIIRRWHDKNFATTVNRVIAVGNETHAYGTWSCVFRDTDGHDKSDYGRYTWVLVRAGDSWKIRKNIVSEDRPSSTN
jgi:uncharacterized protein (TIGR02246 family)